MTKRILKKNKKEGQVVITATLIFMFVSFIIVFGLARPVISEILKARISLQSKQSFFLTESLNEDIIYRLKNSMDVDSAESLTLAGYTATAEISDTVDGKEIQTTGQVGDYLRKVKATVIVGVGSSFNYGVQAGNGGFFLSNNATVNGNVYANGDIVGDSNSLISGSAIAAASVAQTVDQENDSNDPPSNTIQFAKTSSSEDFAQSFQVSETNTLSKVEFFIKKIGSPNNRTIRILSDSGGSPGSQIASESLSSSLVTTSFGWVSIVFSDNPTLTQGNTYWFVIDGARHNSKYFEIAANNAYPSGKAQVGKYNSSWNNTSPAGLDSAFRIYLGGLPSTIDGVVIGTGSTGDAHANTVTNSVILGDLYCQTGSGNNQSCDTSQDDPSPLGWPISDANILEWKVAAEAGGIHNGDYDPEIDGSTVGPLKITGDLSIDSLNLNVTGTLWIEGNLVVNNNAGIILDSGYGSNSGNVIVDGTIDLQNNVEIVGSGNSDSYLMLLTTSDSVNAINAENNVDIDILNAQNGSLNLENNVEIKAMTANQINIGNNTTIDYETGLVNTNFSTGPGGTFNIKNWKEVESF